MVAFVAFLVVNQNVASTFARSARTAPGTVIAVEPKNHAIVRVTYEVGGTKYEVADSFIGPPNPDFNVVRVGDGVTVYYDPAAPGGAVLREPLARASDETGFAVLAALLLSTGFVGALALSVPLWRGLLKRRR
jgi:hypothetical protein